MMPDAAHMCIVVSERDSLAAYDIKTILMAHENAHTHLIHIYGHVCCIVTGCCWLEKGSSQKTHSMKSNNVANRRNLYRNNEVKKRSKNL